MTNQKTKLTIAELVTISSMLFGMFFGAGNLIFPVHLGQLAGSNLWPALLGFVVTGVGLPLLGVAALGKSKSSGLAEMSSRVGKGYGYFFTCLLYLTIGPCFAIPRCATTSFTVGLSPIIGDNDLALLAFSAVFFAVALFFSLKPSGIMTWIGKIINPAFLVFLGVLIVFALAKPLTTIAAVVPDASYTSGTFFKGFLEGYNTMDALASLCFGIVVVNVIKGRGIEDSDAIASNTVKAGFFSCLFMAVIYLGVTVIGTLSRGIFETSENGGIALAQISSYYLGNIGQLFLAVMVTLACLKTSIGLITSIAEAFSNMFTRGKGYTGWCVGFSIFSFIIANFGLTTLITYAIPVLMFLYPLSITIILLALTGKWYQHDRAVYVSVTAFTLVAATFDFFNAFGITAVAEIGAKILPFFSLGLGWVVPALIGWVIGLVIHFTKKKA